MKLFHRQLYLQQYLSLVAPIFPLYAIMFGDKAGLSIAQISALFMWWLAVAVMAEIPTAVIADKLSYKWAVVAGNVLIGISYLTWLLFPHFYGFALGFLFGGVGVACNSGAFQSYVYTELRTRGQKRDYTKVMARCQSMAGLGIMTGFLIAALLGRKYELALVLSMIASGIGALLAATWPAESIRERSKDLFLTHFMKAAREVRHNNTALVYAVAAAVMFSIGGVTEEYLPPFYVHIGFSAHIMPLLIAAGIGVGSALGWVIHRVEHAKMWLLCTSVASVGVIALLGTYGNRWAALGGMFAFLRIVKIASTLFDASLQHAISSTHRATVTSVAAFAGEIIEVVSFGLIALSAYAWSAQGGYRAVAVIGIVLSVAVLVIGYMKRAPQNLLATQETDGFDIAR